MTVKKVLKVLIFLMLAQTCSAERIKDIVSFAGIRDNQLVGYGLVVGLDGTGDQTTQAPFTTQSLKSMLGQLGISLPPGTNPQVKNVAAVALHATLPPFARPGQRIDVNISSIGNAKSLRGGTLLITPLKGLDGNVYAMAQGNLAVGGLSVDAEGGTSFTLNVPSGGRIPSGAIVERSVSTGYERGSTITMSLNSPDFTTMQRVVSVIESSFGKNIAVPLDGGAVQVKVPTEATSRLNFMAKLENLQLDPGDAPARIVINSRTGTVIIGRNVTVKAAAVSHGNLSVTVSADTEVSQPGALSPQGTTEVVTQSTIEVSEERNPMFLFNPGVSLGEIVRAVNGVGASSGDLVSILQALKAAGALSAEITVI